MNRINPPAVSPFVAAALCLTSAAAVADTSHRIIGGSPILIEAAPSIVALIGAGTLETTGSVELAQFCGGTLIDSSWVLTAAHCVVFADEILPPDEIKIVANSHDLNNINGDPIDVASIIVHESYLSASNDFDIALLQLASPAVDAAAVATLNVSAVPINERLVAAGWGARQFDPVEGSFDFSDTLQAVEVAALPAENCNVLPAYAGFITNNMFCAGFPQGGFDSCQGDSGGPLYRRSDAGLIVAGITSWGDGCALENTPGVYTDVAKFNDWIRSNMEPIVVTGPVVPTAEPTADPIADPVAETDPVTETVAETDPVTETVAETDPVTETVAETDPVTETVAETDPVNETGELQVTSNEDGSTVIVLPSLASLNSSGGAAGGWLSMALAGLIALRRRSMLK